MEKRIVILGAGESGTGAAVLAKKQGFDVFVSDSGRIKDTYKEVLYNYEIDWEEGKHTDRLILNASEVIKSPGISEKSEIVMAIRKKGIKVISEIEFAGRYTQARNNHHHPDPPYAAESRNECRPGRKRRQKLRHAGGHGKLRLLCD